MAKKEGLSENNSIISTFDNLGREEKLDLLSSLILSLKEMPSSNFIPIGIFDNDKLSTFETLVKYLKETLGLRFVKIASLLGRSDKTIWATYKKARQKMPLQFHPVVSKIKIPIENFSDSNFTIFEGLVFYLKNLNISNHEIGIMLQRDDRTIWSVYDRAKKKKAKWAQK